MTPRTVNPDDVENVTIPDTPAGLEEMLGDPARMQGLFAQKDGFATFIRSYAKVVLDKDQEVATQVREETQRVLSSWLKEQEESADGARPISPINYSFNQGTARPSIANKQGLFNPRAMGAQLDNEFKNAAEFFTLIWHNRNRTAKDQAQVSRVRNSFSSTVPSEGGFLVPETLRSEMLQVALERAVVRPRARVIPMETLRVPFPAVDSTSNVSSVFGGVVAYWTEEGGQLTESQASFSRIVLEAKKLTAYAQVPNELLSDSVSSFQAFIDQMFPQALGFYEDDAFMNGNGVGMPDGVLKAKAMVQVAAEASQPSATILWQNILKMYSRMLPSSLGNAYWIASIDTMPELATMALSVGTGGSAIWLNNGQEGFPMSILGRPVIFTEKCPALGLAGDINFIDFSFYLIGDRQVMSAMSSPHFKFQNDDTAYRIIQRVDGKPWLQSAITPKNGSTNTLSPYVQLAARP
jgi:HK97 family phage major capsid protein